MKAVLQNFKTGEISVTDVPPPALQPGRLLINNAVSLVSAGTEKAFIELARKNYLEKAKARPDLVQKVFRKISRDGLLDTFQAVSSQIGTPLPLGYSCAGIIQAIGPEVSGFQVGERVACAGAKCANHAEVVSIPRNLLVKIPDNVSFEEAAFVTVGAIAVQGARQAELTFGERVVVIGLGLIGQLTVQICVSAGCQVFGIDLDPGKVALAQQLGATEGGTPDQADLTQRISEFTRGIGADAVLITAASKSSEAIRLAAELARDRGRVVAVGDVGLEVPRRPFFEKELDLRLSRSYGPGRYDPTYEEKGIDYPVGYVRWTENRNMEAFLDLVSAGKIRLQPLITHRHPIEQAEQAYALLNGETQEPYIAILLDYSPDQPQPATVSVPGVEASTTRAGHNEIRLGVIGAGQFAKSTLLPKLASLSGVCFQGIATASGLSAPGLARKYGALLCTSDYREILAEAAVNTVLIATPHNQHAEMVIAALKAGKHVFVEKPLALNEQELQGIITAAQNSDRLLMVGFNRRFSPFSQTLKAAIGNHPFSATYRVNAGPLPAGHWLQDPAIGGGRIIGEVCHFVDLLQFLSGSLVTEVRASKAGNSAQDDIAIEVRFANGSLAQILYTASGHASAPKERLEVFAHGTTGVIDNWRRLKMWSPAGITGKRAWLNSQKGHREELQAFVTAIQEGKSAPIPLPELVNTTRATFAIEQSLQTGQPVTLVR